MLFGYRFNTIFKGKLIKHLPAVCSRFQTAVFERGSGLGGAGERMVGFGDPLFVNHDVIHHGDCCKIIIGG